MSCFVCELLAHRVACTKWLRCNERNGRHALGHCRNARPDHRPHLLRRVAIICRGMSRFQCTLVQPKPKHTNKFIQWDVSLHCINQLMAANIQRKSACSTVFVCLWERICRAMARMTGTQREPKKHTHTIGFVGTVKNKENAPTTMKFIQNLCTVYVETSNC